jgi:hypothetical protein
LEKSEAGELKGEAGHADRAAGKGVSPVLQLADAAMTMPDIVLIVTAPKTASR